MKKASILLTTITLFLCSNIALATSDGLPNPGITPDSPFYFLDSWGESISMFFAFSDEAKADKNIAHAEEKLAEAKKMAEEGKTVAEGVAEKNYAKDIDDATTEAKLTGKENALQRIQEATTRHQAVMEKVLSQVPEQAKASIQKAMDKSSKGHQNATDALNGLKGENNNSDKSEDTGTNTDKGKPENPGSNGNRP